MDRPEKIWLQSADDRLGAAHHRARASWPDVVLEPEMFAEHLRRHASDLTDDDFAKLRIDELYLACACARGNAAALRALETHYMQPLRAELAKAGVDHDELIQRLRERLLVAAPGDVPRIALFAGRGRLKNWLRIAVRRLQVDLHREQGRVLLEGDVDSAAMSQTEPEVQLLRRTFAPEFNAAFEAAFARLTPRQRRLLRQRYVDRLEVNHIASLSSRHRISITTAIAKSRALLLSHLRRELMIRCRFRSSEVGSVMRGLWSQFHPSLFRLLASSPQ